MSKPTTRNQFIENCLRRLGAPVIQLALDEDQIDDRVDEALDFFFEHHMSGVNRNYYTHVLTQEDFDTRSIPSDVGMLAVTRVITPRYEGVTFGNELSTGFQLISNNMTSLTSALGSYVQFRQSIADIQFLLNIQPTIEFVKHAKRIDFPGGFGTSGTVGSKLIIECFTAVDPQLYSSVWSDRMLQLYTTALIKKQWGANMMKYQGVALVGGNSLNGQQLYDQAVQELEELDHKINTEYQEPAEFMVG